MLHLPSMVRTVAIYRKNYMIYSEHLSETIDEKLAKALAMLQPALFSIIAICILAAYLALLLPVYGMMDKL